MDGSPTVRALVLERDLPRFGAARLTSALAGSGARVAPLRLADIDEPTVPRPDWVKVSPRLSGICGSDLATIAGRSSRWFEPVVSFPFTPGHEVVATDSEGRRVVVEPVLGCVARGVDPICPACADGRLGNCGNLTHGPPDPGLQSGFCCDAGGGWAATMTAHPSQLHEVPDELDDTAAVLIEPTACAVHAALAAGVGPAESVALIGAGTLGQMTAAALARWSPPRRLIIAAKYDHQRRAVRAVSSPGPALACCSPGSLIREVRRQVRTGVIDHAGAHERLTQGVDVTIDCVGSADSLASALAVTRPGGRVVLVGMPSLALIDLTPLWQREITLVGAYTYGVETLDGHRYRTFDLAAELVAAADLGSMVSAIYPLERHVDALDHAAAAGRRGATKIAFILGGSDAEADHPAPRTLRARR